MRGADEGKREREEKRVDEGEREREEKREDEGASVW